MDGGKRIPDPFPIPARTTGRDPLGHITSHILPIVCIKVVHISLPSNPFSKRTIVSSMVQQQNPDRPGAAARDDGRHAVDIRWFIGSIVVAMAVSFGVGVGMGPTATDLFQVQQQQQQQQQQEAATAAASVVHSVQLDTPLEVPDSEELHEPAGQVSAKDRVVIVLYHIVLYHMLPVSSVPFLPTSFSSSPPPSLQPLFTSHSIF